MMREKPFENKKREWRGGYINTVYKRGEDGAFIHAGFNPEDPWTELYGRRLGYVFTCGCQEKRTVMDVPASVSSCASDIADFIIAMDMVPDNIDVIACINRAGLSYLPDAIALPDEAPKPDGDRVFVLYDDGDAGYEDDVMLLAPKSISNVDTSKTRDVWTSFFDRDESKMVFAAARFRDDPVCENCDNESFGRRVANVILTDAIAECADYLKLHMEGRVMRDQREIPDSALASKAVKVLGRGRYSFFEGELLPVSEQTRKTVYHLLPLARKWAPETVRKAEELAGLCRIWDEGNRRYWNMCERTLFRDAKGKTTLNGLTRRINRDGFVDAAIDAMRDGIPLEDVLA